MVKYITERLSWSPPSGIHHLSGGIAMFRDILMISLPKTSSGVFLNGPGHLLKVCRGNMSVRYEDNFFA